MMKKFLRDYPPLDPFRHPLDVSTPLKRMDFWLFYTGYILTLSLTLMVIEIFSGMMNPLSSLEMLMGLGFMLGMLPWIFYLLTILVTATARRMKDSGYRRAGLVVSVILGGVTFYGLSTDVYEAYNASSLLLPDDLEAQAPIPFKPFSIWSGLALLVSLSYVFLGTVRKTKKVSIKLSNKEGECQQIVLAQITR